MAQMKQIGTCNNNASNWTICGYTSETQFWRGAGIEMSHVYRAVAFGFEQYGIYLSTANIWVSSLRSSDLTVDLPVLGTLFHLLWYTVAVCNL